MQDQEKTGHDQDADQTGTGHKNLPIHLDPSQGEQYRFKPGQSGNPKGRPKGRRNLSTMIQDMLNDERFIEKLSQEVKDKVQAADPEFQGTALKAMITTAMVEAIDPNRKATERDAARNFLAKYGYGSKVEVSGPNGEPLGGANPYANLSPEELRTLAAAQRNDTATDTRDPA